jgi:acyl carrier protein phosphodiesterase
MLELLPRLLTDHPSELTIRRVMTAYSRHGGDSSDRLRLLNRHLWAGKWLATESPVAQRPKVAEVLLASVRPLRRELHMRFWPTPRRRIGDRRLAG